MKNIYKGKHSLQAAFVSRRKKLTKKLKKNFFLSVISFIIKWKTHDIVTKIKNQINKNETNLFISYRTINTSIKNAKQVNKNTTTTL